MVRICFTLFCLAAASLAVGQQPAARERWPADRAWTWYKAQPWIVGCNFIPSNAVNQLEMWQADTFDPKTIDRELGWAAGIGMNSVRVYLHDVAWEVDPKGFKERLARFLEIAEKHGIRPLFVLFDDCWNAESKPGKQPEPVPGVHNSGWLQSPGVKIVNDPEQWERLERYVRDVLTTFAQDKRILMWDLYNEPGNSRQGEKSLPLLKAVFAWARKANPEQPLTAAPWTGGGQDPLNVFMVENSDVITFHNYNDAEALRASIKRYKELNYPMICTEWLARKRNSRVETHLPIFQEENVGCFNWGLVMGKTNTIYPWGSEKDSPEPPEWFHDLFRLDGTPFDEKEIRLFRDLTGRGKLENRRPTISGVSTLRFGDVRR